MPPLLPVETAREMVLAAVGPLGSEDVPLESARGRILAEEVTSPADVPPFDSSAMDGFAVPPGASGELAIAGESRAQVDERRFPVLTLAEEEGELLLGGVSGQR